MRPSLTVEVNPCPDALRTGIVRAERGVIEGPYTVLSGADLTLALFEHRATPQRIHVEGPGP